MKTYSKVRPKTDRKINVLYFPISDWSIAFEFNASIYGLHTSIISRGVWNFFHHLSLVIWVVLTTLQSYNLKSPIRLFCTAVEFDIEHPETSILLGLNQNSSERKLIFNALGSKLIHGKWSKCAERTSQIYLLVLNSN